MGFDDSKALSADTRQALWESFDVNAPLCYSSATLSPQAISANMLRRVPVNLTRQAEVGAVGDEADAGCDHLAHPVRPR
jgi:ribonuclease H2 subunit A